MEVKEDVREYEIKTTDNFKDRVVKRVFALYLSNPLLVGKSEKEIEELSSDLMDPITELYNHIYGVLQIYDTVSCTDKNFQFSSMRVKRFVDEAELNCLIESLLGKWTDVNVYFFTECLEIEITTSKNERLISIFIYYKHLGRMIDE